MKYTTTNLNYVKVQLYDVVIIPSKPKDFETIFNLQKLAGVVPVCNYHYCYDINDPKEIYTFVENNFNEIVKEGWGIRQELFNVIKSSGLFDLEEI